MLRPEPMTRTLVVSSRRHSRAIIETLYDARAAHLVEFEEDDTEDLAMFRLGRPLEEGSRASELLVRLRALERHLDLEDHEPATTFTDREVEEQVGPKLVQAELDVTNAVESRDRIREAMANLEEQARTLEPFTAFPLDLEDYRGYRNLEVLVGTVTSPVEHAVANVTPKHLLLREDDVVALFVPTRHVEEVNEVLFRHGFKEVDVPEGEGPPARRLDEVRAERDRLAARLQEAERELDALRDRYGDFVVAAEEHLSIESEKAEAPLAFATSPNAFVVEAWVPEGAVDDLRARLHDVTDGNVHVETQATEPKPTHAAHEPHEHEGGEGHDHGDDEDAPPTKYDHPGWMAPFSTFTDLFSTPRYDEVDPTIVLATIFPFFYGIMIGDAGYGLIMLLLGLAMATKLQGVDAAKGLGYAFLIAGAVAALTGAFVYGEAFGIHWAATEHAIHELEHEHLALTCANLHAVLGETTWSCLVTGELGHWPPALWIPTVSKLTDVGTLLVFSVLAAYIHVAIGLLFGLRNEWGHSTKHAAAKVGWLLVGTGFFIQILHLAALPTDPLNGNVLAQGTWDLLRLPTGAIAVSGLALNHVMLGTVGVGAVLLVATEGAVGFIELPSMLSTILSYTRLAGVAVAKAAMAVAFNGLFLVGMVLGEGTAVLALVGLLLLVLGQLIVLILGILSSGIQAIRLNYVEHFRWFYNGGGKPFTPFGRPRSFTTESP